jgi:transposase InsO family protein
MPWKEATRMSERAAMVAMWESGEYGISELARVFGVSRPTVYLWIGRWAANESLEDRAPMPQTCPHRTSEAMVEKIVATKLRKPLWGPRKLIDLLRLEEPERAWPAASTAGRILEAHDLVQKRRRRRKIGRIRHATRALGANESGEMMTIDHKGWFRLGNRAMCYPLTINDPVSRFVYAIDAAGSTRYELVKASMEAVFREFGVPLWIGSDNGSPFCSTRSPAGLSRLSVWWIRLGSTPVRIHPGCPWENGIHERMHRTLKGHTTRPPADTMEAQQRRFDEFRREFNYERPHEGLNGVPPIRHLKPCRLPYPDKLLPFEYPAHAEVRRVRSNGEIKWQGELLFLSETLIGELVALEPIGDAVWSLRLNHIEFGRYDERTKKLF